MNSRYYFISTITLICSASVALFIPRWASLGSDGQYWGLLENCPVCVIASRFIGPIAAVETASKIALLSVWFALGIGFLSLILLFIKSKAIPIQLVFAGIGGVVLSLSTILFVLFLPDGVPVKLGLSSYVAFFGGLISLLNATLGFREESTDNSVLEERNSRAPSRLSEASAAATYGTVNIHNDKY